MNALFIPVDNRFLLIIVCLYLALITGCANTQNASTKELGNSQSASVQPQRKDVFPFGTIPYDNVTLPLTRPDGLRLATQTGLLQDPLLRMGTIQQTPPYGAQIEVYELIAADTSEQADKDTPSLQLAFTITEPLLLGRSCSNEGFTVEAPQTDGSRWIGIASWETGEITWLVQDDNVNIFAALGPDGRLAWSRRVKSERNFELVVRVGSEEWSIADKRESWLLPTWPAGGQGLFAMRLIDDRTIEAVYMHGTSAAAMKQSQRTARLTVNGNMEMAVGMCAAQPAIIDTPTPKEPLLVFQHPLYDAVAVWRPFRPGSAATQHLSLGSTAAAVHESGFVVFAERGGTKGHMLDDARTVVRLSKQVALPYVTHSELWPFLLFTPTGQSSGNLFVAGINPLIRRQ